MQKQILEVKSNLNHSGVLYAPGDLFEATQGTFADLVRDGVLRVVPNAETIAEAEEIIALEKEKAGEQTAEVAKEKEPEDTWAPKPDAEEDLNKPVEYTGPMVEVTFLQDYEVLDEKGQKTGEIIKAGEVKEVPEPVVQYLVEGGFVEEVTKETNTTYTITQEDIDASPFLLEAGLAVGQEIELPANPEGTTYEQKAKILEVYATEHKTSGNVGSEVNKPETNITGDNL